MRMRCLTVAVVDSATDGSVSADTVYISVEEGSYREAVNASDQEAARGVAFVPEREGTYNVAVLALGYLYWEVDGIRVAADECHVRPVSLTARLVPQ